MSKSLFLKTFFSYLLIMALVLVLVFLFSSSIIENQYRENVQRGLGQLAASLQRNFVTLLAARDTAALDVLVKELGKETDARLTVIATDGRVLADSEGDPLHMENHADRPEFILAMQGQPAEFSRLSSTLHRAMLYRAVPIRRDGRVIGVLRLSRFVSAIEQMLVPARRKDQYPAGRAVGHGPGSGVPLRPVSDRADKTADPGRPPGRRGRFQPAGQDRPPR